MPSDYAVDYADYMRPPRYLTFQDRPLVSFEVLSVCRTAADADEEEDRALEPSADAAAEVFRFVVAAVGLAVIRCHRWYFDS